MRTVFVLKALVLSALALGAAQAAPGYCGCSSGCDVCQPGQQLPLITPKLIKPAVYRTVVRESAAPCEYDQGYAAPDAVEYEAPAPAVEYERREAYAPSTSCYRPAPRPVPAPVPAPTCRTHTSCKTKNVVELVKTYEPRYRYRTRPVKVCTSCKTCEQPLSTCDCARRR